MSKLDFKTSVIQMRPVPGNVRANLKTMLAYIDEARAAGAKLVVFPELCVTGYMLGDRWEDDAFIRDIEAANEEIRKAATDVAVVWGSIRADWDRIGEDGRVRKYNAAMVAEDGEWAGNGVLTGWVPKTNLPKYRIFDDPRHFYPADKLAAEMKIELADLLRPFPDMVHRHWLKLSLAVCEDLWEDEYNTKLSEIYAFWETDLLIDISSSPWTAEKWHARDTMLKKRAAEVGCPILYVNIVGLQNNGKNFVFFDGGSALVRSDGEYAWLAGNLELCYTLSRLDFLLASKCYVWRATTTVEIHNALIAAMQSFLSPFPKIVLGLSGGIDSAVSMALMVEALGKEKILAVNMPTEFNSKTTQNLAEQCARNFGVEYKVVPIQELYLEELFLLEKAGYDDPKPLVLENIQARIRGHVLAGIAACEGGVFTNNGNKTEVALNYFTLYGDGAGACAFLADLWKGQVYELARLINSNAGKELIPQGIIDIVPSAELSADQNVDLGKGDPIYYPYHDKLLRAFVESRWDPETVLTHAIDGTLEQRLGCERGIIDKYFPSRRAFVENLEWAWRSYNIEYKRVQLPPVFITSRRAFGFDRRDTIADGYFTDGYYSRKGPYLNEAA